MSVRSIIYSRPHRSLWIHLRYTTANDVGQRYDRRALCGSAPQMWVATWYVRPHETAGPICAKCQAQYTKDGG